MIDADGFRPNVGIVLANSAGEVLWARRIGQDAWQFPQGGIKAHESPEEALYRELWEELGLRPGDVVVAGCTRGWLRYTLPKRYIRRNSRPVCIGQKQVWFLLRLVGDEGSVSLTCCSRPEFDAWCWVDYWRPARDVIFFKRAVYRRALKELAPLAGDIMTCSERDSGKVMSEDGDSARRRDGGRSQGVQPTPLRD